MRYGSRLVTVLAFSLLLIMVSAPVRPSTAFASDGVNQVSYAGVLPGDMIILGTPGSFFDYLIPGAYSHSVIYCGLVQAGESVWDRTNKVWMSVGTPYVIHSTKSDVQGNGLGFDTWATAVNAHAEDALVLRVMKPGGVPLTSAERSSIVAFLKSQLTGGTDGYPVGPAYDWGWTSKQVYASETNPLSGVAGYYCSEAAWAAYYHVLGIDLDSETSTLGLGVSPDDLLNSQHTSVIAGEVGASTWSASSGLYKLTVFVDEVYYDDDYDPWPKGAGEMYLKSFSGDGLIPTQEGYPGCGKIGSTPDGYWSRNGAGALDWNKYFYTILNYNRDAKVRVEAWEDDDIDGDDQYPVWQWYWSPSSWHSYINAGWYWSGSRIDLGDCRYTIYFRIDSVTW
ncbi:MAG: hypothetical protein HXY34_01295 [Candidatus Thorarchaeota archaeon]|nr:hypothetical protein [Candidatus Thorarchaeota archaeon]